MDIRIVSTDIHDKDFGQLIKLLDEDLYARNGEAQKKYRQFNKVDNVKDVFVVYKGVEAVGCGAFKHYDADSAEVKRIFILPGHRGQGISRRLMEEIERVAKSKGYKYAILETGWNQFEAVGLYQACGYQIIDNYEPFIGYTESLCMKKVLRSETGRTNETL